MSRKYRKRSSEKNDSKGFSSSRIKLNRKKRMNQQHSPFVKRTRKKGKSKLMSRMEMSPKSTRKKPIRNLYNGISPFVERKLSASTLLGSKNYVDDDPNRKDVIAVLDSFNFDSDGDKEPTSYMTDFYTHRETVERLEMKIRELTRENIAEKERNVTLTRYQNNFEEMQKELQLLKYKESKIENEKVMLQEEYEKEVEQNHSKTNENQLLKDEKDWIIESYEKRLVQAKDDLGRNLEERHESILQNVREKYKHIIEVQRLEIQTIQQKVEDQEQKIQNDQNEIKKLKKMKIYSDSISQTMKELELTIESQRNSLKKYKSEYERLKFEKSNLVHQTIEDEEEKRKLEEVLSGGNNSFSSSSSSNGRKVVVDSNLISNLVRENRTLRNVQNSLRRNERSQEELHDLEIRKLRKEISETLFNCELKIEEKEKKEKGKQSSLQSKLFEKQKQVSSQSLEIMDLNSKIRKYETELNKSLRKTKESNKYIEQLRKMKEKIEKLEGSKSKVADLLIRIEERELKLSKKMDSFENRKRTIIQLQDKSRKQYESIIEKERTRMEDEKLLLKQEFEKKQQELEKKVNFKIKRSVKNEEEFGVDLVQMKDIELLTFRKNQLVAKEREDLDELKRKMSYELMEEYQRKLKTWVELERAKNRQREVVLNKKFLELKEKQRKFDELESEILKRNLETRKNERASEDTLREVQENTKDVLTQKREIEGLNKKIEEIEKKKKEFEKMNIDQKLNSEKQTKEIMSLQKQIHDEERKGFKKEEELKYKIIELQKRELEIIKSKEKKEKETRKKNEDEKDSISKKYKEERESFLSKLQTQKNEEIEGLKNKHHKKVLELTSIIKKLEQVSKEKKILIETKIISDLKKSIGLKDSEIESLKDKMKKKEEEILEKEKVILEIENEKKKMILMIQKKKKKEEEEEELESESEEEEEESETEDEESESEEESDD